MKEDQKNPSIFAFDYRLNEKAQQFEICTYTFKVFCLLRLEFEWVINDFYSHTSFQMKWKTITLVFQKNNIEIGALNGWGFLLSTKNVRVVHISKKNSDYGHL